MTTHRVALDPITLTRVGYADAAIPPEIAGLSADEFPLAPWREPLWTEGDQLRAGAAAWFVDTDGARLVVDPVMAADDLLRAEPEAERAHQDAIAGVFTAAGFDRASVDRVVVSHIEGVGMVGWRNGDRSWSPFFPNAQVLVSAVALDQFLDSSPDANGDLQHEAWHALIEQGVVESYADGELVAPGVRAEVKGGHCPGHAVLHVGDDDRVEATMLGHLAVSPLHLVTGECPAQHVDAAAAWSLLHQIADDGRILIGPLWPAPGFGRWLGAALVTE